MSPAVLAAVARRRRRSLLLVRALPSYALSSLTAASATGTADGVTGNVLTLTLYDTNGVLMPGRAVTITTELTAVSAGQSTLVDDAAEIATTTGTLNLILVCKDANGVGLPNIQSARIVYASTGTGNTFGTPSVTDKNGQSLCTFSSTVAEAKTISVTVDGVLVTQTASVTVTGTPGLPTMDWFSDFSHATGDGADARGDGASGSRKWDTFIGNVNVTVVVASTGLDFPTTNTMKVTAIDTGGDAGLRKVGLTVPGIGETQYRRVYFRVAGTASAAVLDTETHPIQDGSSAGQINHGWWIYHSTGGAGKWTLQHNVAALNGFPNYQWRLDTVLDHDTTYRLESAVTRIDATTFTLALRVYNTAGTLLYDSSSFRNATSSTDLATYMASNTFTFFNVANLGGQNGGSNGVDFTDWHPSMIYSYQSGFAVSRDDWCGAYDAVNG